MGLEESMGAKIQRSPILIKKPHGSLAESFRWTPADPSTGSLEDRSQLLNRQSAFRMVVYADFGKQHYEQPVVHYE